MAVNYSFRYDHESGGIYGIDSGGFLLEEGELEQLIDGLRIFYRHHGSLAVLFHNEERREEVHNPPPSTKEIKKEREARKQSGYVYLLQHGEHYKIGITKNLNSRVKQISPVMPLPIVCLGAIKTKDTNQLEKDLHELYSEYRLNGEWFEMPQEAIDHFLASSNVPQEDLP